MREKRKPLVPMDFGLRRRGLYLGTAGIIVLFGSAIGILFLSVDLLVYLLVPMAVGFILLVAGYVILRQAERKAFERSYASREKKLK